MGTQVGLTLSGDVVGTLRYMSPEQALGKHGLVDHRTDVYALGATLYELLTLRPVVVGNDREELLQQIDSTEPVPLRRLNRAIPADLETVVLKALEKDPADRYATAQELADDLRRFLENKPILARRPTLWQRARKWSRRHPAVVAATAVVLAMALMLLGGVGGWLAQRRLAAEAEALRALAEAEAWQQKGRWLEARAAAQRAEGLLTGAGGRPKLRQRTHVLLSDLTMVERLENIRLEQSEIEDNHFDIAGADAGYAQAFRDYGVDVEKLGLETATWIRTRSISVELAVGLDNWAMARRRGRGKEDGSWKQFLDIALLADPDPLRTQVRQALETQNKTAVEELAKAVTGSDLPATTLVLLARALRDPEDAAQVVVLLREGQRRHPSDFWLNCELSTVLQRAKPPQFQEAVRFSTAALALRPSPGIFLNLGFALKKQGRLDEAVEPFAKRSS
jgi:tetratricopeptide (TPR) repeat protein